MLPQQLGMLTFSPRSAVVGCCPFFMVIASDVNVSFFVNETNLFFAFDHEKMNDLSFFTFTKPKY
jgi:hypothetical protein